MNVIDRQIEVEIPKGRVLEGVSLNGAKIEKPSSEERKLIPICRSTLHSLIAGITSSGSSVKTEESAEKTQVSKPSDNIDIKEELAKPSMTLSDLHRIVGKNSAARFHVKPAHTDSLVTAAASISTIPGDDPKAA